MITAGAWKAVDQGGVCRGADEAWVSGPRRELPVGSHTAEGAPWELQNVEGTSGKMIIWSFSVNAEA